MTYIPVVTANVSAVNSTTTALGSSGTFTGTAEDVSQYSTISLSYYVQPQNATGNLFVQFSNTATSFYPVANLVSAVTTTTSNGFTLDFIVKAQYFRVLYVNDSVAQTKFMIQTIFNPQARIAAITDRLARPMSDYTDTINTRALIWGKTNGGNIYEQIASNGQNAMIVSVNEPLTAFGELSVSQNFPIAQVDFVYGINSVVTSNVTYGNASVTASNSLLILTANASAGTSMVMFRPKKFIKYRPGQSSCTRITATFTSGAPSDSIQFCGTGFLEPTSNIVADGMGFGYQGSTFGVFWFRNYSQTFIPQTNWNYDTMDGTGKSGFLLDPTKINIFQLKFHYLGGGNLFFYVMPGSTGRWALAHMIQNAGALTTPVFGDPTMHAMWYSNCYSVGSNTPVVVQGASLGQYLEGERRFLGPKGAFTFSPSSNLINNTNMMMFALRNATYFNGRPNRSQAHIRALSFGGNGSGSGSNQPNGTIALTLIRNPTNGPTIFTPYNGTQTGTAGSNIVGQSSISSNIGLYTGFTGGNNGFTHVISIGGQSGQIDLTDYEIVLNPADTLTFTANVTASAGTVYAGASVFWVEDL